MSSGKGETIQLQSTSDTVEIAQARILVADSSGDVLATTVPGVANPVIGVSASKVASRDAAAKKDIAIQVSGLASVPKSIASPIAAGAMVYAAATTTTVGTGSGSTCLYAASATTLGSGHSALGRAAANATTTDTTVKVLLNLEA